MAGLYMPFHLRDAGVGGFFPENFPVVFVDAVDIIIMGIIFRIVRAFCHRNGWTPNSRQPTKGLNPFNDDC